MPCESIIVSVVDGAEGAGFDSGAEGAGGPAEALERVNSSQQEQILLYLSLKKF